MKTKAFLLLSLLSASAVSVRAEAGVADKRLTRVESNETTIDLRPDPRKVEPGASELLAFSAKWADPSQTAASVEIALGGAPYLTLPGGEGMFGWTPDRGGLFTFTHMAVDASGNPFGDVYQASFLVDNYTFGEGDVTASGWSGVYDGQSHSISVMSTVDGATVKYATAQAGPYSSTEPSRKDAGSQTVWYVVEAPFYLPVTNSAAISISKRPLTVTAASKTKAYGAADPALTYTSSGLVSGESLTGSLKRDTGENVGAYAIRQGTLAATSNYTLSFTGATFTITKGTIGGIDKIRWGVSGEGARFLYDGAEHEVLLTGLPAGVTATYAGNKATDAGDYIATAHLVYDTANYETVADPAPLAWSIAKRPITLMAASKEKPYDGWPLEVKAEDITVAGSGYAPGECLAYGDYASITDVGEIPATFSYADSATAKVANYDVTVQGGQTLKITVGGDQISVTADSAVWAYDGQTHRKESWTTVNGDKLLAGHVFDIAISTNSAVTTPAEGIVSNAFDHVKIVEASSGRDMTRNYNLFVYEGTLQVTNAPIGPTMALHRTVEAVYDGQAHSAAVEPPSLLTPPTVRYRVGAGDWTAEAPSWTHAGTYTAQFEVSAPFYDPATGTVQVAISPRPVSLTSPTKSKPFDGTPLTFGANEITVGGDGIVAGESFVFSNFASITDAGRVEAAFAWSAGAGTLAADYDVTVEKGTLTVTKNAEEISVTAKSATWVYDGETHALHEWTAENLGALVAGDALDVAFDPASAIAEPGETTNRIVSVKVMRGGADVTANYTLSWWPGTLKVTKAEIGPKMAGISTSATSVYDGAGHAVTVEAPTLLTAPVTVTYAATASGPWGAEPVAFTDAGAWTAFFRVEAPNYEPYVGTSTMTITPREVTLVSAGATKVYDGTPLRKDEVSVKSGSLPFVAGEGFTATCSGTITDVGGVENVFDYALAANTKADNYTIRKELGWLRVTPATLDVGAIGDRASWRGPYDGEGHGINVVAPIPQAVVTYALESGNEEAYGSTNPTWTDVSTHVVYFKILAPNYEPGYGAATVEITKRPITLMAASKEKPYDGWPLEVKAEDITVAGSGYAPGECLAYGDYASITDVGEIPATFSYADSATAKVANYDVTVQGGQTLKITVGGDQISVTADSAVWAYDGQTHRKESWTTVNGDKLLAGHVFDIAISTNSAVTTPAEGVVSNAFDHVRIVDADGADRTRNYNLFVYEGTLQVTNAPIGPTMALHRTVEAVYDGQAHSAAVEPPSLLTPPTVRYRVGDGDWTAEAPAWTHAGTYTAQFEVSAQFYDPATGTVQVAISPRPLTVRADAKSKVYGDADPELTYSVSNLVEGDSVSGALTREAGEAEGTYRILQGTLTAGSNYEIAFTGANFKITKRNVSVRPASWSKTYGEPDPEFTAEVTGLANGDTATVIFSRTEGEDVGEYEIRIDRVEFSGGNYRVSVKTAKLTIVPRPATVRAVDASKVFGAADPSLEWKSDDLIGDDTLAGSPIRDPGEAVGEYAIRIGSLTNPNYAVSFVDGVFEILPGGIVVDASAGALGYTGEYDGAAHGAALRVKNPATGATVQWSATAGGPWANASPTFVDAGTNTVWWRVTAPNFDPLAGTAQIAIAPRPISKASVGVLTNEYYTGYPVEPVPSVTDTVPITADDWSVAWEDNVEVGRARAIVTGRGNYCGEAVREFEIVLKPIVVIVIDLSSVDVGQGKWGTASLATNGVPVDIAAGSRVELELPQGTPVALSFAPDPGFKIGSVIVDRRTWSTQAEWAFEAKADRAFQASYIPNPQTTVRWKLATATGHYHAQLAFPVYPGYEEALAGLKFHFADRVQDGKTYAQLWDYTVPTTAGRHLADEEELDGKKYRFVPLDASKMAGLAAGSRVVYGVTDATLASATAAVPQAQRLIGLYIQKRVSPVSGQETDAGVENFIGAFSWETNGKTYYQPVGEGYPTGVIAEKILDAEDLDAADALGFDPAFLAIAEPACRFTDFAIDPVRGIGGAFEIYAATPDGIEAVSAGTTANAAFRLWGTERLGGEWVELDRAVFPGESGGTVRFSDTEANVGEFRFFRATIEVRASHE